MKRLIFALAVLVSASGISWSQGVSTKAKGEIERRAAFGLTVEHVDDKVREDGAAQLSAAAELPENDSYKFRLHLIVAKECAPCERLKWDLEKSPLLTPKWLRLDKIKQAGGREVIQSAEDSWMHVVFEPPRDPLKPERFAKLQITAYPTILLMPPLDGRYGDPGKVIRQLDKYENAAALDAWLTKHVLEHVQKFQPVNREPFRTAAGMEQRPNPYGPLPFPIPDTRPAGPLLPNGPLPIDPAFPPLVQPQPAPVAPGNLGDYLLIAVVVGNLALGGWALYRTYAKAHGQSLVVSDEQFEKLKAFMAGLMQQKPAT
jgi:hypothetical protein